MSARVNGSTPRAAATASPDGSPVASPRWRSRTASERNSASRTSPVIWAGRRISAGTSRPSIAFARCGAGGRPGRSKSWLQSITRSAGTGRKPIRSGKSASGSPAGRSRYALRTWLWP